MRVDIAGHKKRNTSSEETRATRAAGTRDRAGRLLGDAPSHQPSSSSLLHCIHHRTITHHPPTNRLLSSHPPPKTHTQTNTPYTHINFACTTTTQAGLTHLQRRDGGRCRISIWQSFCWCSLEPLLQQVERLGLLGTHRCSAVTHSVTSRVHLGVIGEAQGCDLGVWFWGGVGVWFGCGFGVWFWRGSGQWSRDTLSNSAPSLPLSLALSVSHTHTHLEEAGPTLLIHRKQQADNA